MGHPCSAAVVAVVVGAAPGVATVVEGDTVVGAASEVEELAEGGLALGCDPEHAAPDATIAITKAAADRYIRTADRHLVLRPSSIRPDTRDRLYSPTRQQALTLGYSVQNFSAR